MKTEHYSSFSFFFFNFPLEYHHIFLTNLKLRCIVRYSKSLGSKSEDAMTQPDQTQFGELIVLWRTDQVMTLKLER